QCGAITGFRVARHVGNQEVVAVGLSLDQQHQLFALWQKANRCQPSWRTQARGTALNVPTKNVLNAAPFHPLWSRDFTGNRSATISTLGKTPTSRCNSPHVYRRSTGASSC